MKHWAITFWNVPTDKRKYREYPQAYNLRTWKGVCDIVAKDDFKFNQKDGWIVEKVQEYDPIKSKNELAKVIGKLIYS